jgi:hypothetical protein
MAKATFICAVLHSVSKRDLGLLQSIKIVFQNTKKCNGLKSHL